jgi:RNA polymerase sigma-70 factor, ECF subfamily
MNTRPALSITQGTSRAAWGSRCDTDSRLLLKAVGGESQAYSLLWERHHTSLLGYFLNKTNNRDEAEDLASETLIAAFLQASDYRAVNAASFRTYLFSIAHNKFCAWVRNKPKRGESLSANAETEGETDDKAAKLPAPAESDPLCALLEQDKTDALCCALADVALRSADQLSALALHYGCQMSHKEIAALNGMRAETVNTRLQEGRRTLKRHFERENAAANLI